MEFQLWPAGAAQNDAARRIDHPGRGDEVGDKTKEGRHGVERKHIAGQKNGGHHRAHGKLHGGIAGAGLGRHPQPQAEHRQHKRKSDAEERREIAVHRHLKDRPHQQGDAAELDERQDQVRKQFAENELAAAHRCHEKLLERAVLLFTHDGCCG